MKIKLQGDLYDALKFLAMVFLPALGTLYFALGGIWGLPAKEEVIGTITAVDAFLGGFLHLNTAQYNASDAKYDGHVNVDPPPTEPGQAQGFTLSIPSDPDKITSKDELLLKVNKAVDVKPPVAG